MSKQNTVFPSAKKYVANHILIPAGFVKGRGLFARHTNGQFHGVEFQASKYGGEYFVNVAFHYDFVPAITPLRKGLRPKYTEFSLLDFMLQTRLETLMAPGYPSSWQYSERTEKVEEQMEENTKNAIAVLDAFGARWKDPADFLRTVTPELIQENLQMLAAGKGPRPVEVAIGPWIFDYFDFSCCLALIAVHLGQLPLARSYLEIAKPISDQYSAKFLAELAVQFGL